MSAAPFKYLDYPQVCELVGLSKTPIRSRIKAGTFPAPVALLTRFNALSRKYLMKFSSKNFRFKSLDCPFRATRRLLEQWR